MKYFLISVLFLPACGLFYQVPKSVRDGIQLSHKLAKGNQENIRAINEEYSNAWKTYIKDLLQGQTLNKKKLRQDLDKIDQIYDIIVKRAYSITEYQIRLTEILTEWAHEPGVELIRLHEILKSYIEQQ